jgi:RimJ/RimL family protein N-acetyltransferase
VTRIVTERLVLRRARPDDLAAMHRVMSDPRAMRYWSTPPHPDIDTTREWLDSMINSPPGSSDDFIVERDGIVIGKMGAWRLPDIGYMLAPAVWGQGYATEALSAFIGYAFAERTDFLTADVDPRNAASLALLARAGFRETGRAAKTWCVGDEWCDSVYMRLDRIPFTSAAIAATSGQ